MSRDVACILLYFFIAVFVSCVTNLCCLDEFSSVLLCTVLSYVDNRIRT
jgi:hypothetical protein